MRTVRVTPEELLSIRKRILGDGERYGGADLDGALMDFDQALFEGGFGRPKISRTGDVERMVVLVSALRIPILRSRR